MIHRFNDLGMRSLDPQWAGGRPRQITTTDRALIVNTATTRPRKSGRPFIHWSIRKLADYLATKRGRKVRVGRERLRQILHAEAITFPAHQDVEGVARPAQGTEVGPYRVAGGTPA
jgi:transposase